MAVKAKFGSKIGLIAATVGSAVGLGNVWRFPAETQANGGAAFLLVYIICVFILGIPVMVAEFSLGRGGNSDAAGVFSKLSPGKKWWIVGAVAILASYLIMSFYMVVAGWTLEYLWQSITGSLYSIASAGDSGVLEQHFLHKMQDYIMRDTQPLVMTYIVLLINLGVLIMGVQKGIEKASNILMPILFVILLVFATVSVMLPKAGEGLAFFLSPDFSKVTPQVIVNALGQAFFSLSLGMGILITYSSYFPSKTNLGKTALTVSLLDMLVAVLMGVIIFPAVMSFDLDNQSLEGATLVFVTLPEVFMQMPFTQFWSTLFFLLLLVAALSSTISLAEVSVAFLQDHFKMPRVKACVCVIAPLFVLSSLCSLSQGSLSHILIFGRNIFDFLDFFATNLLLPIVACGTCVYLGWFAPKNLCRKEVTNHGALSPWTYNIVFPLIRYVAPVLIAVVLFMNI